MKKNKLLKVLKSDINSKLDHMGIIVKNDVEIICEDKECLLNDIFEKMDNIIYGKNKLERR